MPLPTTKKYMTAKSRPNWLQWGGIQVTDYVWEDIERKKWRKGYYMSYPLAANLLGIPKYLDKAWDVVGIIGGHGKVRIGKSTIAQQVGFYIAWLLAGGKMDMVQNKGDNSPTLRVTEAPTRQIHFNLEDNIVFSPEDLMKKASKLYEKYGRNQVIIYDEGRAGLDSARAMEAINKVMQDFFQECGQYGHVILIVLPNFFKLHEDYAVNRSLFLIDVFADKKLRRGYFNFYNEQQKEYLYFMGKKKVGNALKYSGCDSSFSGRFTKFLPIDKEEYEAQKAKALKKKQISRTEIKWKKRLNASIYLLKRETQWENDKIAEEIGIVSGDRISEEVIKYSIQAVTHKKEI